MSEVSLVFGRVALILLLLLSQQAQAVDPKCQSWFDSSKIKSSDQRCESRCSTLGVDMGTYYCPDQCDALCKPRAKCEAASKFWQSTLKEGSPKNWEQKGERARSWRKGEVDLTLAAISKIPQALWSKSLEGIYRKEKSVDYPNAASTLADSIVLYDTAFGSTKLERIIAHEFAHQYWVELSKRSQKNYMMVTGWTVPGEGRVGMRAIGRKSGYVEEDGVISPGEDFANNVEYYLSEPDKLKKVTPGAFEWIQQRFGRDFKLGAKCYD